MALLSREVEGTALKPRQPLPALSARRCQFRQMDLEDERAPSARVLPFRFRRGEFFNREVIHEHDLYEVPAPVVHIRIGNRRAPGQAVRPAQRCCPGRVLGQDPLSRVACETATKTGFVMLLGEITTRAFVNFDELARKVINEIGYDNSEKGFDGNTCGVQSAIASQSSDIAMGVDKALEVKTGQVSDEEIDALAPATRG
jgi:hypothetical protein